MVETVEDKEKKRCSFCKLSEDEVATLIQGPNVWICNSCVELCREMLDKKPEYYPIEEKLIPVKLPKEITTIGELRRLLSQHHYETKVKIDLE